MDNNTNNSNKVARVIGQAVGIIFVGCVAVCLCGIMVGLSIKFLAWMF